MSLYLSSFWVVWPHGHKFSPPPFLHLSCFLLARSPSKSPLFCSCCLFANFPSSFLSLTPHPGHCPSFYFLDVSTCLGTAAHSSPPQSLHPSACFLSPSFLFVYSKPTLPFSRLLFSSSLSPSLLLLNLLRPCFPLPLLPYRWRLTGERSAIRPPDCLLLRRWMEAPSASPTQPQLHQPP